jgi:hypothetical protein
LPLDVRSWLFPVFRSLGGERLLRRNPDIRFRHREGPLMTHCGHSAHHADFPKAVIRAVFMYGVIDIMFAA